MKTIAVIDVGKTNAKLALVDAATLQEVAVVTRPNIVQPGPPWPHFDLSGHWEFFLHHLGAFHTAHGVDAISVTTHGASVVLLDHAGELAAPMLDYEHDGPEAVAAQYDALRPDFAQTGSPRLARGMNIGAQLHWMLSTQPDLRARVAHVLTYPQYWGWRLTAEMACDVTSLGCHSDLWNPWQGGFSPLVDRLGLTGKFAPPRRPDAVLGHLRANVAAQTGLLPQTPVSVDIHDSNASLYPYLGGPAGAFSVVSTGTWVVCMAMGGATGTLDPARDVLVNVNAQGQAVPSARFMGGREFDLIARGERPTPTLADADTLLRGDIMLLPAVEPAFGPFQGKVMHWTKDPTSGGQRLLALSWYLALMTRTCLDLIGARGPVIVEGPFAHNKAYLSMLAAVSAGKVESALSSTGTSVGAALLVLDRAQPPVTQSVPVPDNADRLRAYAQNWTDRAQA